MPAFPVYGRVRNRARVQLRTSIARSFPALFALLLVVTLLVPAIGCNYAGNRARDGATIPALKLSSVGLRADVEAGVLALPADDRPLVQPAVDRYFGAVESGDRQRILAEAVPEWPVVRVLAFEGIAAKLEANLIGPNGAESLRERVRQTEANLDRLRPRPVVP